MCRLQLTGHCSYNRPQNLETLRYYLEKPTLEEKENYADDLFAFTGNDDNESDLSDFEVPQPSKPNPKSKKLNTSQQQL